jgi:Alpha/beta hydrolase domain containing 18
VFHNLRSLGGRLAFFKGGWGQQHRAHRTWLENVRRRAVPRPQPPNLSFQSHPIVGQVATFESPSRDYLPPESARGRVWIVEPNRQCNAAPVVVHLAATGDHGFWFRYVLFSRHLARLGIVSALLENPLYGARTPSNQRGAKLHTVANLADMGRATIEEAHLLLTYFYDRGHRRLATFGISQGGLHAAMAASLCDFRVHTIGALAPASAAPVFTSGVLESAVDWDALSSGIDRKDVRGALASHLDSVASIARFPESSYGGRHVLLAASEDEYVRSDSVDAWRAARPDVEVRYLQGVGHVTAVALRSAEFRRAIVETVAEKDESVQVA